MRACVRACARIISPAAVLSSLEGRTALAAFATTSLLVGCPGLTLSSPGVPLATYLGVSGPLRGGFEEIPELSFCGVSLFSGSTASPGMIPEGLVLLRGRAVVRPGIASAGRTRVRDGNGCLPDTSLVVASALAREGQTPTASGRIPGLVLDGFGITSGRL